MVSVQSTIRQYMCVSCTRIYVHVSQKLGNTKYRIDSLFFAQFVVSKHHQTIFDNEYVLKLVVVELNVRPYL